MKINRLLEIVIILLNKKCVTAKYLADKFDVSTRTIYRDIDDLSCAGIPIYTSKGSNGGISLLENYTMNRALLSDKESESILLALKTLQATQYPEAEDVINKMGAIFKSPKSIDWIEVDFAPWGTDPNSDNKFDIIKKGLLEQKVISFDYINANNKKSNRQIEPYKLFYKGRYWYLVGHCLKRNNIRIFKLSRMKNVDLTNNCFIRRETPEKFEKDFNPLGINFISLHLRFSNDVLYRLYDDFNEEYIKVNECTTDVIIDLPYDEWLYSYILSFGNSVEVLSPFSIRKEVIKRLEESIKKYK